MLCLRRVRGRGGSTAVGCKSRRKLCQHSQKDVFGTKKRTFWQSSALLMLLELLGTCWPPEQREGCPFSCSIPQPLQDISMGEVVHPRVLLYPKLPPSAAGDLFDSEVSVMPAGFTSHILPHFKVTQTVMSESCLKMLNPRDHAEMAQNYRWIFQPSVMSISTSSQFSLLFVAFKGLWLQTADKRMLCRDVTGGIPGRSVRGEVAVPPDWNSSLSSGQ